MQGKAEQWLSGAERLGRAERRLGGAGEVAEQSGLAGQSGGLAERGRWRSFVERQSFWVFPLQLPPFQNCIDPMQMVEVE